MSLGDRRTHDGGKRYGRPTDFRDTSCNCRTVSTVGTVSVQTVSDAGQTFDAQKLLAGTDRTVAVDKYCCKYLYPQETTSFVFNPP